MCARGGDLWWSAREAAAICIVNVVGQQQQQQQEHQHQHQQQHLTPPAARSTVDTCILKIICFPDNKYMDNYVGVHSSPACATYH
ncbi:hypothetical protein PUN28_020230 [Cardiocondyla obscurior]|uniref:Secreted protein n=1 Tax=Cardiocondyla obscurior TaxID=286306 RepID=A0AAW2E8H7_9HYME